MATKRKKLALSSDDEKTQSGHSGVLSEDNDNTPLFTPRKESTTTPQHLQKAPVAKEDIFQVNETIVGK